MDEHLRRFFRIDVDLPALYSTWNQGCPRFAQISPFLVGMRLLRQDPVECLFSFIASSNNHIPRITSMLARLRSEYGTRLSPDDCFSFPTVETLSRIPATELDRLGFGYRSAFIVSTAKRLQELGGRSYLESLMGNPAWAREELIKFHGVGPKVADCVSLFSLECLSVVPVDTHVLQVAEHRDTRMPCRRMRKMADA